MCGVSYNLILYVISGLFLGFNSAKNGLVSFIVSGVIGGIIGGIIGVNLNKN